MMMVEDVRRKIYEREKREESEQQKREKKCGGSRKVQKWGV